MSKLLYHKPAKVWEEALPLGNGRLGGMVFGETGGERIQVNEESVWLGGPMDRLNPDAGEALPKVRELIREGKPKEAQELMGSSMTGCPCSMHPYQTLGDLEIWFEKDGEVTEYVRELDLETACCKVEYTVDRTTYTREMFVSKPADALIMRVTAKGEGKVCFGAKMGRGHYFDGIRKNGNDGTFLFGNLGDGGFRFGCMLKAVAIDGSVKVLGETIVAEAPKEALLFFTADTSYHFPEAPKELKECYRFLELHLQNTLTSAMTQKYETLLREHVEDYRSLYSRVELTLGEEETDRPTDERLEALRTGSEDIGLQKLLFDYGRYLLISCSRPGGLPATLQGIWNKDFTPPWESKYTININAQMNYWPAESCNLSECHEPLFELLERVRETGRKTAREMYGCRGFTAHHNTNLFGDSAPQDLWYPATFWTLGGAWLSTHLWTHYQYTKDIAFLEKAFPTMLEAALFFVDFLTEWNGYLVTNPSVSPENTYILPSGEQGCCCMGPTMDNQILRDLFTACVEGYELLGERALSINIEGVPQIDDCMMSIREVLKRLVPTQIGSDGRIMEWLEEYEEAEPGHRHISHLYGLYPSDQITVDGTPELAQAAAKTLQYRLDNGGGHTGWSIAWITNHYAKLWDGEKAYDSIQKMLVNSTYPNMFDKHPPFQIDGNFGICAAIANMLVQSTAERIVLLPALPKEWKDGKVTGLKVKGNAQVDLTWKDGKLLSFRIKALSDYSTKVLYGSKMQELRLNAGEEAEMTDIKSPDCVNVAF